MKSYRESRTDQELYHTRIGIAKHFCEQMKSSKQISIGGWLIKNYAAPPASILVSLPYKIQQERKQDSVWKSSTSFILPSPPVSALKATNPYTKTYPRK